MYLDHSLKIFKFSNKQIPLISMPYIKYDLSTIFCACEACVLSSGIMYWAESASHRHVFEIVTMIVKIRYLPTELVDRLRADFRLELLSFRFRRADSSVGGAEGALSNTLVSVSVCCPKTFPLWSAENFSENSLASEYKLNDSCPSMLTVGWLFTNVCITTCVSMPCSTPLLSSMYAPPSWLFLEDPASGVQVGFSRASSNLSSSLSGLSPTLLDLRKMKSCGNYFRHVYNKKINMILFAIYS